MVETIVSVDKICIRYSYDASSQSESEFKQLQQFKESVKDGSLGGVGKFWKAKKAAMTSMWLPLASGAALVVRYGFVHGKFWSWFEFNPARLSQEDQCCVAACMDLLFTHGAETLWSRGRISRLDIAVDARQAVFEDCLLLDKKLRASQHLYDASGSTYLGSAEGKKSVLIYDKAKERWDKSKVVVGLPWVRLEARLRDPKKWALHDIFEVRNPFATMLVVDRSTLLATDCKKIDSIKMRVAHGEPLDRVYWELPPLARSEIWDELHSVRASWWDPQILWKSYEAALTWVHELRGPAVQSIAKTMGEIDQLVA